jgi:predicted Zn-dependent protease
LTLGVRDLKLLKAVLLLMVVSLILGAGGWYARGHYWLPKKSLADAELALQRDDFDGARQELEKCLRAWPRDPRACFLMARTERRAGNLHQAEIYLTRCEHLQDDRADPRLGDTQLEWALVQAQRGKLADVEPFLRRRIKERHPDVVLIFETVSWELMGRNRLNEALALLDLWLEQQPDNYEALVRHGWVEEHIFNLAQAVKDYVKALALEPERHHVRQRVVELLLQENRTADALPEAEELCRRQPDSPDANYCYARCLHLLGRDQEAEKLLDQLLADHPRHAGALGLRGQLAFEAGKTPQAADLLKRAMDLEPANRELKYKYLLCLKKLGKTDEAKDFEAKLAEADAEIKRMDTLVREVNLRPNDPALRYEAGVIFLKNGMTEDGLHWLFTALNVDPRHRPTHQALAEYYERNGDKERAAQHRAYLGQ